MIWFDQIWLIFCTIGKLNYQVNFFKVTQTQWMVKLSSKTKSLISQVKHSCHLDQAVKWRRYIMRCLWKHHRATNIAIGLPRRTFVCIWELVPQRKQEKIKVQVMVAEAELAAVWKEISDQLIWSLYFKGILLIFKKK